MLSDLELAVFMMLKWLPDTMDIAKKGQQYALLEVDTSDNQTRRSTLLIKQPMTAHEWAVFLPELETLLVKNRYPGRHRS